MANFYKSVLIDPTDTNLNTVYTAPSNARAIIQNIQVINETGTRTLSVQITRATVTQQIAYASLNGVTNDNLAKGPIILQENDELKVQVSDTTGGISCTISLLELSRADQNG